MADCQQLSTYDGHGDKLIPGQPLPKCPMGTSNSVVGTTDRVVENLNDALKTIHRYSRLSRWQISRMRHARERHEVWNRKIAVPGGFAPILPSTTAGGVGHPSLADLVQE